MYMYVFRQKLKNPENSKLHGFEFHRPSSKGTPQARVLDYRVAKTHRIPYLYRLFSAKETYI